MSRTFSILSRTESTMSAVAASVLSAVTVGVVLASFASVAPSPAPANVYVMERVVITAARSV